MLDCAIIRDLLPQYNSGTLSSASPAAIDKHAHDGTVSRVTGFDNRFINAIS